MPRLTRNPLLREDLIEIWTYIAKDNADAADRLLDRIEEKFVTLAHNPGMGRMRSDIGPEVRHFPVDDYLVLYRETRGGVEIVRVIHGRRDLSKLKLQ
jgi:toxin ParE1/3/4